MICQNTDSPAIIQVAQGKGVYAIGWDSDMTRCAFGDKRRAMIAGPFHLFRGSVKYQSGKIRVAAGKVIPMDELMGFNWCVEGVDGTIPK